MSPLSQLDAYRWAGDNLVADELGAAEARHGGDMLPHYQPLSASHDRTKSYYFSNPMLPFLVLRIPYPGTHLPVIYVHGRCNPLNPIIRAEMTNELQPDQSAASDAPVNDTRWGGGPDDARKAGKKPRKQRPCFSCEGSPISETSRLMVIAR